MLTVETVLNGFLRSQLFLLTLAYLNSEWYKICDKIAYIETAVEKNTRSKDF